MKQPELGKKITALRKAKGLTQEELVSKCNINVRTIQRIESGEVSPRSYTVKIILEAMDYDLGTIQFTEREELTPLLTNQNITALKVAFFMGIVYFGLSFVEAFVDLKVWGYGFPVMTFNNVISLPAYLGLKISILITYVAFIVGYYQLSTHYPNAIVKTTSLMLAGLTTASISVDVYSFYTGEANEFSLFMQAVLFGMVYVILGIGMIKYKNIFGTIALAAGVTSIICGMFLMTVILALPGLVIIAVFEILQLIMLYRAVESKKADVQTASAA